MLLVLGSDVAGLRLSAVSAVRNLDVKSAVLEEEADSEFASSVLGCIGSEFTDHEQGGLQVIGRYTPSFER
ncbi:hypothetical protein [Streptomyces sp. TM32]|uniref:hypothetical protein n=1 Tax=Streptomyces sp. TM32 TaxID=1652669 RepID=UPI0020B12A6D|nr:hypothetical protein [Streptomyces sp. TM32]